MTTMAAEPKKRGRKPIGEKPMTQAEAKRASRARLKGQGVEFSIRLEGGTLNFVDQFAAGGNVTRSRAVLELLDFGIAHVAMAVARAEQLVRDGRSQDEARLLLEEAFRPQIPPQAIETYKEVMGAK